MTSSLVLFTNSACYHLGDWSPRVTDVLRRIDHVNIFLLIAGTYTPVSFALEPFWRNIIIISMWACTVIAIIIHVIWINAPRWLYTVVYIIFGIYGLAYMVMFWNSPYAGPAVVVLLCSGGACYILGAIVYALRKPDPWPRVFGFHEIFHCGTVAGYASPHGGDLYGNSGTVALIATREPIEQEPETSIRGFRLLLYALLPTQASGLAALTVTDSSRPFGAV